MTFEELAKAIMALPEETRKAPAIFWDCRYENTVLGEIDLVTAENFSTVSDLRIPHVATYATQEERDNAIAESAKEESVEPLFDKGDSFLTTDHKLD